MPYLLRMADNWQYMREEENFDLDRYETAAEALAEARRLVDRSLLHLHKPGVTAAVLGADYTQGGRARAEQTSPPVGSPLEGSRRGRLPSDRARRSRTGGGRNGTGTPEARRKRERTASLHRRSVAGRPAARGGGLPRRASGGGRPGRLLRPPARCPCPPKAPPSGSLASGCAIPVSCGRAARAASACERPSRRVRVRRRVA